MGFRLDGVRVYKVKAKSSAKGKRKTYPTKKAALAAFHKRGKRKHRK
jgi:hypothetical protein